MTDTPEKIRFQPGSIVATLGALQVASHQQIAGIIARHLAGDWGDLDESDKKANERAQSSFRNCECVSWLPSDSEHPQLHLPHITPHPVTVWHRSILYPKKTPPRLLPEDGKTTGSHSARHPCLRLRRVPSEASA